MFQNGNIIADAPLSLGYGSIRTPFGILSPPVGVVVAYVGAEYDNMPQDFREKLVSTLALAVARCQSGRQNTIYVLPGHTENFAVADSLANLVAGTKIIGLGQGRDRPAFTWTAAVSTVLIDVANVAIENCILNLEPGTGTITVAAAITVSAAGFRLANCDLRTSTDTNNKCTIPITTTAAGDYMDILGCRFMGATTGECTTVIRLVGSDFSRLIGNYIEAATTATAIGVVQFLTTASTFVYFADNVFVNNKALSSQAVTGLAAVSGACVRDFHCILDSTTTGVVTPASLRFNECRVSNLVGEAGMVMTVVSTNV